MSVLLLAVPAESVLTLPEAIVTCGFMAATCFVLWVILK